jgi:hypothetical protein
MPTPSPNSRAGAPISRSATLTTTALVAAAFLVLGLSGCFPLVEEATPTPQHPLFLRPPPLQPTCRPLQPTCRSSIRVLGKEPEARQKPSPTEPSCIPWSPVTSGGLICDRFGRNYWQLNTVDDEGGFNCYSMIYVDEQLIVNNDRKPL